MIYAYDENLEMPTKDLYDSTIIGQAIAAARDAYTTAQKQLEQFHSDYDDFTSPLRNDVDRYNTIMSDVYKEINNLYANGEDPLRTAVGRSAIARLKRSIPVDEIRMLKQSATNAQKYMDLRAQMMANGTYDDDYEKFFNKGLAEDWDTIGQNQIFNLGSPRKFRTLKQATQDWFDKRTPHLLTKDQVIKSGHKYDPGFDYIGYTMEDMLQTAGLHTPAWRNSPEYAYYRSKAEQQLRDAGEKNITPDTIDAQLMRNVAEANPEYLMFDRKANQYALANYQHRLSKQDLPPEPPKTIRLNYDGVLTATAAAKLFGGDNATIVDSFKNWQDWGKQVNTIEDNIIKDLKKAHKQTSGGFDYKGLHNDWMDAHTFSVDGSTIINRLARTPVQNVSGENNGHTMAVNAEDVNNLYTTDELMSKNKNKEIKQWGDMRRTNKTRMLGKDIRSVMTSANKTYMSGNTKTREHIATMNANIPGDRRNGFTQVEDDNRIHYYVKVHVNYGGKVSSGGRDKTSGYMWCEMPFTSEENGITKAATQFMTEFSNDQTTNKYANAAAPVTWDTSIPIEINL